ncbi:MAG TPA: peptidylprolyl isomerase [Pyrinomonadaceae bacterium]|nr:peptidylprolyl isomerase [Pyrinomonadaceae bacterium]
MEELNNCLALEVNGEEVSLYEVLRLAKLNARLRFVQDAVDAELIRQAAEQRGIEVSDEELQQAADDFRAERELHDVKATDAWLTANHLSFEDWEVLLEGQIIRNKLRKMLTAGRVEQRFTEQRLSFDAAAVSRIVLKEEGIARELRAQIVEDGADFHTMAREHSIEEATRLAGGYVGLMHRSEMEAAMEAAVFGAQPGRIVGPIKTDDGWELIKLEFFHLAALDDSMRETIKSQLFDEWLSEQRLKARISTLLETSGLDQNNEPD